MALNIVKDIDARIAVKHVLMSVSDKTGLETFVPALVKACPGVKIYSTGGTYVKVKEILGADAEGTLVAVSRRRRGDARGGERLHGPAGDAGRPREDA